MIILKIKHVVLSVKKSVKKMGLGEILICRIKKRFADK